MKRFLKYLSADCADGIRELWRWYVLSFVVFVLLAFAFDLKREALDAVFVPTWGDRIASLSAGMAPYAFRVNEPFSPPIEWLVPILLNAYLTLWYPFRSLAGYGGNLIAAGGSRWAWWLAKCAWVIVFSTAFWVIGCAAMIIPVISDGGTFSLSVSSEFIGLYRLGGVPVECSNYAMTQYFVGVLFVAGALGIIQLVVSLCIHPIIGYAGTVAIAFFSAYVASPFLIGNYAMSIRSDCLVVGGFNAFEGMAFATATIVALVVVGGWIFSKMDFLARGRDL